MPSFSKAANSALAAASFSASRRRNGEEILFAGPLVSPQCIYFSKKKAEKNHKDFNFESIA
jgi:hypothetical protein